MHPATAPRIFYYIKRGRWILYSPHCPLSQAVLIMSIKPGKYRIHTFSDYNRVISVEPTGDYQKPVVVASPAFSPKASIVCRARSPLLLHQLTIVVERGSRAGAESLRSICRRGHCLRCRRRGVRSIHATRTLENCAAWPPMGIQASQLL